MKKQLKQTFKYLKKTTQRIKYRLDTQKNRDLKLAQLLNKRHMPIVLMYHHITDSESNDPLCVSKKRIEEHIAYFASQGYIFVFESEWKPSIEKQIMLTFDDGYFDNYKNIFPLLKKYNAKASINVIARELYGSQPEKFATAQQLQEMISSKLVEVNIHTYSHLKLSDCNEQELQRELVEAKLKINSDLDISSDVIVYPCGSINQVAMNIVTKNYSVGYGGGGVICDPRYMIPRIDVTDKTTVKRLTTEMLIYLNKYSRFEKNY